MYFLILSTDDAGTDENVLTSILPLRPVFYILFLLPVTPNAIIAFHMSPLPYPECAKLPIQKIERYFQEIQ